MSSIQFFGIIILLAAIAVKLDPHEALEIIVFTLVIIGLDRRRKEIR